MPERSTRNPPTPLLTDIGIVLGAQGVFERRTDSKLSDDVRQTLIDTFGLTGIQLRGLIVDADDAAIMWLIGNGQVQSTPDEAARTVIKKAKALVVALQGLGDESARALAPALAHFDASWADRDAWRLPALKDTLELCQKRGAKPRVSKATAEASDYLLDSWVKRTGRTPTKGMNESESTFRFYEKLLGHIKLGSPRSLMAPDPEPFFPDSDAAVKNFRDAMLGAYVAAVSRCQAKIERKKRPKRA